MAAAAASSRQSRKLLTDYTRINVDEEDDEFYGESTTEDDGTDDEYILDNQEEEDDITTLVEAEEDERRERQERRDRLLIQRNFKGGFEGEEDLVLTEQDEIRKLVEEGEMEINDVLQRLKNEAKAEEWVDKGEKEQAEQGNYEMPGTDAIDKQQTKHVTFASSLDTKDNGESTELAEQSNHSVGVEKAELVFPSRKRRRSLRQNLSIATTQMTEELDTKERSKQAKSLTSSLYPADAGSGADDEADASDVEDFVSKNTEPHDDGGQSDSSGEFQGNDEADDEATLEAEEKLGRDMSPEEEIAMLQREGEMSIEELRAKYLSVLERDDASNQGDSVEDNGKAKASAAVCKGNNKEESSKMDNGHTGTPSQTMALSDDDEFQLGDSTEIDDETTIEAEERLGKEMSHEEEIALLQKEGEMSIDELRAMYTGLDQEVKDEREEEDNNVVTSLDEDDHSEEEEFHPDASGGFDDETTLDAEEKLGKEMSYEEEIDMLKRESEISLADLRAMYGSTEEVEQSIGESDSLPESDASQTATEDITSLSVLSKEIDRDDNASEEEEFQPDAEAYEVDDETTIDAEEKLGRDMSYEEEIAALKRENDQPIEKLRAMYAAMEESSDYQIKHDIDTFSSKRSFDEEKEGSDDAKPTSKRVRLSESPNTSDHDEATAALRSLEASDKKARQTAVSRPFLLSSWVKLRAYQQIGLNWLVSIQARRLNGILADEMGLGKTLQTISLLSYLASYKGIWGPHLVIVPTSCIVNWEVEIKRFCPSLKVLCYYGSAKRRKELRTGWTKTNWNHVIVTSYQLAVQDAFAFKRKKWYYLILDEAQNIKNFQSQRWQTLVSFNTQRRLLLTGTPLQNNLMELWSLLHFLMPHVFRSRKEFSYWFSNPMDNIIEGNTNRNDDLIGRLHGIIRPFVLRRLKKDVETQMPGKFEHVVKCQLSRRQMFLYEEFMSRSSTRMSLQKGGNFMGMMNVLMQLRKVCNHPDLFEPRSVITPFASEPLSIKMAGCVVDAIRPKSPLHVLSSYLLHPLWSLGCGITAVAESCCHDEIRAKQLHLLETPSETIMESVTDDDVREPKPEETKYLGASKFLKNIWKNAKAKKECNATLHANINTWRCHSPTFPFPDRLLRCVKMEPPPLEKGALKDLPAIQIAQTPSELLAMRRSQQEYADDLDEMVKKFVFCVPKAGAQQVTLDSCKVDLTASSNEALLSSIFSERMENYFLPFRRAKARLTSFFPDKKLVQFDAGKLQTLAELLRDLKRNGHRVLIFTQMSKMLDILEAFLNLNGHTYLRLDGGTGVDKRQRLMDRFNNDIKVFCFILSTRSGGLGINLTGADTVVFYDSDWNPAMDAQAQDRAHRIGQTRDVHIYRLVTEHSIEENILTKAKQKRNLDILVMDEGNFHATPVSKDDEGEGSRGTKDVFSKGGLRDILGVSEDDVQLSNGSEAEIKKGNLLVEAENEQNMSTEQMERAMASLEDEDDVKAMRGAQKEVAEELEEFDEAVQTTKDAEGEDAENQDADSRESQDDDDDDSQNEEIKKGSRKKPKKKIPMKSNSSPTKQSENQEETAEEEMEKEFSAWQSKIGIDASTIEASLSPTERYGLRFREVINPFYSMFYYSEQQRMGEATSMEEEWNVEEIEQEKAEEERRAMEDGDLLVTYPKPEMLPRQRQLYIRERARLRAEKLRRKLTGGNWSTKIDGTSNQPFWYNSDTGESIWDKPKVLVEAEADEFAHQKQWNAVPLKPLVHIMGFLLSYPDRMACAPVCRNWCAGANHFSFVRHVLPIEMNPLAMDDSKLDHNHYRSISDALDASLPGDTIELGDGHYWLNDPYLFVNIPLRIIGDENDPSHVVVELSGTIVWKGQGGWMEGVTLRRPRISSNANALKHTLQIQNGGQFDMFNCVLNNEGSSASVALVSNANSKGKWKKVEIKGGGQQGGGILVEDNGTIEMIKCRIVSNHGDGVTCCDTTFVTLRDCEIEDNAGVGISLMDSSHACIERTRVVRNNGGVMVKRKNCVCDPCIDNVCDLTLAKGQEVVPGFRFVDGVEYFDQYENDADDNQMLES